MTNDQIIKDFLLKDPLARFDRDIAKIAVKNRFAEFFSEPISSQVIGALLPFVAERPWRYWDSDTVKFALQILEQDRKRTIQAIGLRRITLDRGMENLFRPSKLLFEERSVNLDQSQGLVRLATEFFPEYLRWVEHVFGNLLEVYWSVQKKGGVEGKFNLKGASALFTQRNSDRLLNGYLEEARNAIAHGEFSFTGFSIEFGDVNPVSFTTSEFLRLFDELCRTSNGLVIGLILFWVRNNPSLQLGDSIPLSMITRLTAGGIYRTGFKLLGIVESNTSLAGRQLHAAIEIPMQSRTQVLGECCRLALYLIEAGARNYDRFLIEINQGKQVSSLAVMLPNKLLELLQENASLERLPEVFTEMQLLWFDESKWKTKLRLWHTLIKTGLKHTKLEILRQWRESGIWIGKGRFQIREIENLGSQGIARIRIRAVLIDPSDSEDEELIREIIYELVKQYKGRFVQSRSQFLDSGIPWKRRPDYIFIDLFRVDGTLRWLRGGGWQSGNVVAIAEYVRRNRAPSFVENPEEIYKNIRLRYNMDADKMQNASHNFAKLIHDIYKDRLLREDD